MSFATLRYIWIIPQKVYSRCMAEMEHRRYLEVYRDLANELTDARNAIPSRPSQTVARVAQRVHRTDAFVDELEAAVCLDDESAARFGRALRAGEAFLDCSSSPCPGHW